ncbi:hypothetical protein AVEN_84868-1 [Araneus ventricosus]|uniref:Peptidase A2 domain-containing protein n=1 Tax=Araneus ventricosus TaxID=182803 RepID=A0A4Y2T0B2_ARAVE|nr:hypothetical protein AVEN_84868-1 [Araneus ventricosus]
MSEKEGKSGNADGDSENLNLPQDGNSFSCSRVAVKVPAFFANNVKLYFAQTEANFRIAGIVSEQTKFDTLVAALDPQTLTHVSDLLYTPPKDNPYTALKNRLLSEFEVSQNKKVRALLEDLDLRDRKPSLLLFQMQELSEVLVDDAFLKNLWLNRLPFNIRTILSISSESLSKLAEMADRMHEYNLREVAAVKASKPEYCTSELKKMKLQMLELSKQIETLNACFASLNAKKRHSRSRYESRERNKRLCFYHYKFGDRAHKCIKPCSFQNNGVKPSEISVASETLVYGSRLYVQDRITKTQFLVDTGSDISCYPKSYLSEVLKFQGTTLFAANGSHIKTFGSKLLSLDLGLQRKLQWPFVIADITKPIIGADFLQQFGLLVDLKKRCLLDPITNLKYMGRAGFSEISNVKTISGNSEYHKLLNCYKGICRPSRSNWASPLHMVPKGSTDWRPTGDYRALNRVTRQDKYPVPHLQDFSHYLKGKKYFFKN